MSFFEVFVLSLIEGLTEFLPVSSTGHLIIASSLMGLIEDPFVIQFNIIIQFGAILAVLLLYWKRFLSGVDFYKKLFVSFLPAAIIGLLVKDQIDALLSSVVVVAWALIGGGVILLWIDRRGLKSHGKPVQEMTYRNSLFVGISQCFAFIPGVSRSAATIIGGLLTGLNKKEAAEYSFFLAVPTLAGASLVKLLKILPQIEMAQANSLLLGFILSFVFALLAIRFFITLLAKTGFFWFGVYRIVLGAVILFIQ